MYHKSREDSSLCPDCAQETKRRTGSIKARNAQGAAGTGNRPLSQRAAYRSDAKRHRSIFAYSLPVLREASPLLFIIHHSLREAPPIGRISGSLMTSRNKAATGKNIRGIRAPAGAAQSSSLPGCSVFPEWAAVRTPRRTHGNPDNLSDNHASLFHHWWL